MRRPHPRARRRLNDVSSVREGEGPGLVFTHGLGGSLDTWRHQAAALAGRFTVLRWELPGHGRSPAGDPAALNREGVLRHLDHLAGQVPGPPVLVGHSIGGYHTLAYAVTRPGRSAGLVLLGSGVGFRRPDARRRYNATVRRAAAAYGVSAEVAGLGEVPDDLVIEGLGGIDVPVLVLVGEEDRPEFHAAADYLAGHLPRATRRTIPGGHNAQWDEPALVAAAIGDFAALMAGSP